jgi:peptide/nickel transport system ATP-binding protein/oligopeptide transport system ATP-binding protein
MQGPAKETLLQVEGLRTYFFTDEGIVPAVDGVSFEIARGQTLGVVGESGCGKSVTALSIMDLIPQPPGRIVDGAIRFEGANLVELSQREMRRIRGNRIGMIFQEPMTSLNPVFTVGNQIVEAIQLHLHLRGREARELAIDMLTRVGIPDPTKRIDEYPHQMSGGMKQRVMIAMALVCSPALLIADEPTTALDVTIQAQILDLLQHLQDEFGMSIMLITHDLAVVAEVSDHVVVMYAGKVVEYADVVTLFELPAHPYTIGLFQSLPKLGERRDRLDTIPGIVPSPLDFPSGCRFRTRCKYATRRCGTREPELVRCGEGHTVACHYYEEVRAGTKEETGPFTEDPSQHRAAHQSGEMARAAKGGGT